MKGFFIEWGYITAFLVTAIGLGLVWSHFWLWYGPPVAAFLTTLPSPVWQILWVLGISLFFTILFRGLRKYW